jgi:HD superfamily phosphohydrolase
VDECGNWVMTRSQDKSFLYDIISNKYDGFDVDKMDYFLRDAHYSGVVISFSKVGF